LSQGTLTLYMSTTPRYRFAQCNQNSRAWLSLVCYNTLQALMQHRAFSPRSSLNHSSPRNQTLLLNVSVPSSWQHSSPNSLPVLASRAIPSRVTDSPPRTAHIGRAGSSTSVLSWSVKGTPARGQGPHPEDTTCMLSSSSLPGRIRNTRRPPHGLTPIRNAGRSLPLISGAKRRTSRKRSSRVTRGDERDSLHPPRRERSVPREAFFVSPWGTHVHTVERSHVWWSGWPLWSHLTRPHGLKVMTSPVSASWMMYGKRGRKRLTRVSKRGALRRVDSKSRTNRSASSTESVTRITAAEGRIVC
jgi:hypothetical protein